jgi:PPK2 family polyphosphate:nucleotide phosphotransferase
MTTEIPMFNTAPHPHLVPYDGTLRVAGCATAPDKTTAASMDWKKSLDDEKREIGRCQHKLFADQRYAVLLIFQALDAAGKDGTIRHVLTGVNPTGIRVVSFKRPSAAEAAHDFLWRTTLQLPERGYMGVFNRSYYEEVLAVRVHPQFLIPQRLEGADTPDFWPQRYRSIVEHEAHLARSGTVILKFWLNVSNEEQRRRLLARIDRPDKRWKFDPADIDERDHWDRYQRAYEDCLNATSRPWAPWYAIPADDKDYARYQVAEIITKSMKRLNIDYPAVAPEVDAGLAAARQRLRQ